jgi:cytochrome c1
VSRFPSLVRGAALLVGVLATHAAAQASDPLGKLDPTHRFAVESMIDSARAAGLPWKILWSRALEGIAKNVDSRSIVRAVRERFTHLKDASAVLGSVGDDELGAAAELMEGTKIKPEQLLPFRNAIRSRSPLYAFTVLGDLITRGVPRDEALSAIAKYWQGGAGDADFMGLFRGVESDILQGLNPGAALQNRVREFPGRAPSSIKPTPPAGEPETPNS